ncbi:DUF4174 domain-containing protein [Euzebyella marina]|uniref:DUF4174 domain-containing protein n=1 Tax=Euzebyella marina TaxID=1761453 RepID=A0A3G2L366_9FLAO|nr:DUF4174 domain-containing protein [Euzebyella marina]AYN66720.1 DUF4174 domain-containing protein [Euzebyella marina]
MNRNGKHNSRFLNTRAAAEIFRFHLTIIAIIFVFSSFISLNAQELEAYRWNNRILIVKAEDAQSTEYIKQIDELTNADENMEDRKLILYQIEGTDFKFTDFKKPKKKEVGVVTEGFSEKYLHTKNTFEVILIGLDGGVKLRQDEFLDKESLFRLIDSMPMRMNEMKKGKLE